MMGRGKRRGVVILVYMALGLTVFLGVAGLAVDMGHLHHNRAKAQRAADAAALAGATQMAYMGTKVAADEAARNVAIANGYNVDNAPDPNNPSDADVVSKVTFETTYPAAGNSSWYHVRLTRVEPLFFMAALGFRSRKVGASATALFQQPANMDIAGNGKYGSQGPMNLSVFGPLALHANGDMFSTLFLSDGKTANPHYLSSGFDFHLKVDSQYSTTNGTNTVVVEIYDPDTYNAGDKPDANGKELVDEYRGSPVTGNKVVLTKTNYKLFFTNDTPQTDDDIEIGSATYGKDTTTNAKWVSPPNFQFDINDPRWNGKQFTENAFRINVQSIDGASENGFNLRAGPPLEAGEKFDEENGTGITGSGRLPINFNTDGTVTVKLGYVPKDANQITIDKFDTDVNSKSVSYTDGTYTFSGKLTKNDEFLPDVLNLPDGYLGGNWTATYAAGRQDTSSWAMRYSGPSSGRPPLVRLVE